MTKEKKKQGWNGGRKKLEFPTKQIRIQKRFEKQVKEFHKILILKHNENNSIEISENNL